MSNGILEKHGGVIKNLALWSTKAVFDAIDTLSDGMLNSCPYNNLTDGIYIDRDIVYELNKPQVCLFDRYFTPEKSGTPAVIIIHGGGFSSGDKRHRRGLARFFASEGYSVFCVNFSLMGKCCFPEPIGELVRAVNHIGDNADLYGIDENKIYITGDSSGAYYAAMLGAFMCDSGINELVGEKLRYPVAGLILNCGIYDLETALNNKVGFITGGIIDGFFNDYSGRCMPTDFIDGNFPPTFLVFSERDVFCKGQGEAMQKKLLDCGVYTESYKARHAYSNHCFCLFWRGEDASAANELMRSFVRRLSCGKINVD
ncbi:MAG: alpha/beta hydrolase [Clostridiales bacterium]|nr:alpha/beta hydrolase [Clostridiales bacterium]